MRMRWPGGLLVALVIGNLVALATVDRGGRPARLHESVSTAAAPKTSSTAPAVAVSTTAAPTTTVAPAPPSPPTPPTSAQVPAPVTPAATTRATTPHTALTTSPPATPAPTTVPTTPPTTAAPTTTALPVTQPIVTATGSCQAPLATIAPPVAWLPAGLPFPAGSTLIADDSVAGQPHRARFAVPASLRDFVCLTLDTWPANGWRLGRGDAEAGEAEDSFGGAQGSGAFRATTDCCELNKLAVLVVFQPA